MRDILFSRVKGGRVFSQTPDEYMKQKVFLLILLCALLLGFTGVLAEDTYNPIDVKMDLSKTKFTGPDDVTVSIRVSNVGDDRIPGPVYLFYPDGKAVTDFGDGGAVNLGLGEFKTWTGTWHVTQKQLEAGRITFTVKYPVPNGESDIAYKNKSAVRSITFNGAAPGLEVSRVISPQMAQKDQKITITYELKNTGNVTLTNIKVAENKSISSKAQTVDSLAASESKQVTFEVTMGSKNLTSSATITYKASGTNQSEKKTVEEATITLGEAKLKATLASSATGVNINETVKLTLTLTNEGNISYSNLKVTDPVLGEVFSNQELAAGATKSLEKEITMLASGEYAFTVLATDNTGNEVSVTTDKVTVNAVDPNKKLVLTVNATADKLEVYSQPALVRFEISVTNASESEAKDVILRHGNTTLYTFTSIKAGETKTITRDTSISMAGKFQFTAACKDLLGNAVTFDSNPVSISYSVPTPEPTTVPQRTPQPLITEPVPKSAGLPPAFATAKNVSLILFGLFLVLLGGGLVLLMVAFSKRIAQRRQSEAALDHLERGTRRDYTAPSEGDEAEFPVTYREGDENQEEPEADTLLTLQDDELPHMKYVRGEHRAENDTNAPDEDQDDLPKAEEAYHELTEEEAAILSGGTGHYRLARSLSSKADDEPDDQDDQQTSSPGYTRHRRTARTGDSEKSADM
jgi:hypothetical protein